MKQVSSPTGTARTIGLVYGWLAFVMTFAFFTTFVLFLGNMPSLSHPWMSPSVDVGPDTAPFTAALIDLGLVALFGLQHSAMARPSFKAWWTRIVPEGLERSTYVMAASLVGFIMMAFWRPIPMVIWDFSSGFGEVAMWALFAIGWAMLLASGISFNIFELLGTRQAGAWYRGAPTPRLTLKTSWLYDWFKHPMYVGVLLGLWMTPHLTAGHALMAGGFTLYILLAMRFEERDLSQNFGDAYQAWRSGCPHAARPRREADARATR
jgi:protein-S-isoprenylcysteine O-methyltransferase Ste14